MDVVQAHRALSDPGRLALAQRLLSGDLSATEIGALFEWSSPLVAHHVKALIDGGLAVRIPSEHDARRAYVSLRHDDPQVVGMVGIGMSGFRGAGRAGVARVGGGASEYPRPERVAFVCTRNSARSKLAAAWWRCHSDLPAIDAGTAPADRPAPGTLAIAEREGLDVDPGMRQIDEVLRPTDLVVVVCDHAHETLPADLARFHWSVPDPIVGDRPHRFDDASGDLRRRVDHLLNAKGNPDGHH